MADAPLTAAAAWAAGHRPPFCSAHWSWLCATGTGKCSTHVLTAAPTVEETTTRV